MWTTSGPFDVEEGSVRSAAQERGHDEQGQHAGPRVVVPRWRRGVHRHGIVEGVEALRPEAYAFRAEHVQKLLHRRTGGDGGTHAGQHFVPPHYARRS